MQIVRTIIWVLALVAVLAFSAANWGQEVAVTVWPDLIWDTKLPAVVIVAFLLGMVPMWLLNLGTKWRLTRRIKTLETAQQARAQSDTAHVQRKLGDAEQDSAASDPAFSPAPTGTGRTIG